MAWTTPLTAVSNATLTAAQWNASVRDNLLETAVAKATGTFGASIFAGNGVNTIVEREVEQGFVDTSQSTASTTYGDLTTAGPLIQVTVGSYALIFVTAQCSNNTINGIAAACFETTTQAAADGNALIHTSSTVGSDVRATVCTLQAVTPGSNVPFIIKYRAITAGTATFLRRKIQVMGL